MKKYFFVSVILALGLSAPAIAAPVQWTTADGGNNHWYELVSTDRGKIKWSAADSLAQSSTHLGQTGYLATITSRDEQKFLNVLNAAFAASSPSHSGKFVRSWLGGADTTTEGTWEWATGEGPFGYSKWSKKANIRGAATKDYLAGWWRGRKWKDCRNNKRNCDIFTYVVEYDNVGQRISPVPLPASLPMIAGGLGMMAFFGRRRKKS